MISCARVTALATIIVLAAACHADADHRRETLTAAGQTARAVAGGEVATLMRAPSDSFRVIYSRPTNLARPDTVPGVATPPGGVTAPFGISTPDSSRAASGAAGTNKPGAAAPRPARPPARD